MSSPTALLFFALLAALGGYFNAKSAASTRLPLPSVVRQTTTVTFLIIALGCLAGALIQMVK